MGCNVYSSASLASIVVVVARGVAVFVTCVATTPRFGAWKQMERWSRWGRTRVGHQTRRGEGEHVIPLLRRAAAKEPRLVHASALPGFDRTDHALVPLGARLRRTSGVKGSD